MSSFAVWIGANDREDGDGWMWTDGSPFAYLNWKPGKSDPRAWHESKIVLNLCSISTTLSSGN